MSPRTAIAVRGFSLIELMVAITLGLLLLLVMTQLMAQQSAARAEIEKSGRQIENGRYAMSLLQEDIQLAGYFGQSGGMSGTVSAVPNPCETGATAASLDAIRLAMVLPLQGYDDSASPAGSLGGCLASGNLKSGTDVLVTRRTEAGNVVISPSATVAGRIYVQATPAATMVGTGGTGAAAVFSLLRKDNATPAELRRYVQRLYFVSPCHVPASGGVCTAAADNGRPIPTLKMLELTEAGFVVTSLVEGIENLQFDYGIDRDGDGAPDDYEPIPSLAEWSNVMTVRVSLLARALEPSAGHVDSRSYVLGDSTVSSPGDAYKRQAFSVAVRAVNLSGRRE